MYHALMATLVASIALPGLAAAAEAETAADLFKVRWVNPPANAPRGVTHHTFESPSMSVTVGYNLYQPPESHATQERYPVIYFLHGRAGHESKHIGIAPMLDNAIRSGRVAPFFMVFVNGGRDTGYIDSRDGTIMPETMIVHELIPHIDAKHPTVADRTSRGIEGFSMGSGGALRLALKYPDVFSSAVLYGAGGMRVIDSVPNAKQAEKEAMQRMLMLRCAQLGSELEAWRAANSYYIARVNRNEVAGRVAIRQVIGTEDFTLPNARTTQSRLVELKIPCEFELLPEVDHNLKTLYRRVGLEGLRLHQARTAARPVVPDS